MERERRLYAAQAGFGHVKELGVELPGAPPKSEIAALQLTASQLRLRENGQKSRTITADDDVLAESHEDDAADVLALRA